MAKAKILDGGLKGVEFELSMETIENIKKKKSKPFLAVLYLQDNAYRILLDFRQIKPSLKNMIQMAIQKDTWITIGKPWADRDLFYGAVGKPDFSSEPEDVYPILKIGETRIKDLMDWGV